MNLLPAVPATSTSIRRFGAFGLAGVATFLTACTAAQFLRPDLDWQRATLSRYLLGDFGVWVQAGYFALAMTLVALGIGFYRALQPAARSGAPLLLFTCGGLALCVTATTGGWVHISAAQAAFLCTTTAMMLQSWRFRGDSNWAPFFTPAFALAVTSFVALWVYAFWRDAPRGLAQKSVILLILVWLAMASWGLFRSRRVVGAGTERAGVS